MGAIGCLKVSLLIINALVVLLGVGLFGVGVYLQLSKDILGPYLAVAGVNPTTFAIVLFVDGVLCIAIGIAGSIGANSGHRGCLVFYATILSIIFLVLVIAGALIYSFRSQLGITIRKGMVKSLSLFNSSASDTNGWNKVQVALKCCGVSNYTDYDNSAWNTRDGLFPGSCCGGNTTSACDEVQVYNMGCFQGTLNELASKWYTWGGAAIGVGFSLLVSVFMTCCYYREIASYESV